MKNYSNNWISEVIELEEKIGQIQVCERQLLPKVTNDHFKSNDEIIDWVKQQYEKIGITIISEHDNLFWNVELPDGWKIKATDHTMWNELLDDKGRKRARFFYKASPYDRYAWIGFLTRFSLKVDHIADVVSSEYEEWVNSDYQGTVSDGDDIIFKTECVPVSEDYWKDNAIKDCLRIQLEDYMNEHYPDYKNINAYWD